MNKKIRIFVLLILFAFHLSLCSCTRKSDKESNSSSATRIPEVHKGHVPEEGLERFLNAQTPKILQDVENELTVGHKTTHWIWFIFPQIDGLSPDPSYNSKYYSIKSLNEAKTYLNDSVLGCHLILHAQFVLNHKNTKTLLEIFDSTDEKKFISSMTLFLIAAYENKDKVSGKVFADNLRAFNSGNPDHKTLDMVGVSKEAFNSMMAWAES